MDRPRMALGPSDRGSNEDEAGHGACVHRDRMPVEGGDPNAAVQDGIRSDDKGDCDDAVGNPIFHMVVSRCLERHCAGDWGDVDEGTWQQNDEALEAERGGRYIDSLFSLYDTDGVEIYIITEIESR